MNYRRILAGLTIFFAIIFLPYWIYLPILFLSAVAFSFFWEGILFGFLIDALYGDVTFSFSEFFLSYGFWVLVVVALSIPVRHRIRRHA